MQERNLIKISLILIIIGFTFLVAYSEKIDLNKINSLDKTFISEEIKIQGKIDSLNGQDKATFLTITGQKTETVDIILFNDKEVKLKEGDSIEISGIVEEYKGKKEIIASEIILT
tara:strand:- start:252 stop:596 length:345 start_codon:yes stop_codon:yes gene_type:complete